MPIFYSLNGAQTFDTNVNNGDTIYHNHFQTFCTDLTNSTYLIPP